MRFVVLFLLAKAFHYAGATQAPMVTPPPSPLILENLHLILGHEHEQARLAAASALSYNVDGEDYCIKSTSGSPSICNEADNLLKDCDQYVQDSNDKYLLCQCTNGYVPAYIACGWCNDALGMAYSMDTSLPSLCISSLSTTIAPIPSSVLAIISSLNATNTGSLPTGIERRNAGLDAARAAVTTASSNSGNATAASGNLTSSSVDSDTWFGLSTGGSFVVTLNGGSAPTEATTTSTIASATSTAQSSSTNTGSRGWNTGLAVNFSAMIFVLTVLCLL